MELLQAVVLGLVQGLTEFLPVSSTAHLRLVPALLGWGDPGAAFSAVIQLGTVAAVLAYFSGDLLRMGQGALTSARGGALLGNHQARLAWAVLVGTVPIGLLGLAFKRAIETSLRSLWVIGLAMVGLALVLLAVERLASHRRSLDSLTVRDGLWVGLWQALALVPGASRSGTTLTGALALGFQREAAARFSFLLSIPATTLAGLFELKHLLEAPDRPSLTVLGTATAVAFASGLLAIWALLRLLRTRSTLPFIVYRLVVGGALLAALASGVLAP